VRSLPPFRGRKGRIRLKLLYWGRFSGLFGLYYKVLERGRLPLVLHDPRGRRLDVRAACMLWEGIDWRRPDWGAPGRRSAWLKYWLKRFGFLWRYHVALW